MTEGVPERSGHAKDLRDRENLLIAIGGGSASGKSTLASKVEERFDDAVVLGLDDYYLDDPDVNRDHPQSIDWGELKVDLLRLLNGRVTTVPTFDFEANERGPQDSVKPADVIVVEGLWACDLPRHAGITPDHSAYVSVPEEIRYARRVLRDVEERGCETHEVVERWQEEARPMHYEHVAPSVNEADYIVHGEEQPMDGFVTWIESEA